MSTAAAAAAAAPVPSTTAATLSTSTHVDITLKLPQLQNLCKRDPVGYRSDYDAQIRRLQSECDILRLSPSSYNPSLTRLVELIQFAAAVSSASYSGEESDRIAALLVSLLTGNTNARMFRSSSRAGPSDAAFLGTMSASTTYLNNLHKDVRKACVSALILMRNKGAIPPLHLLELFLGLMGTVPDKHLREMLYRHVVNDVRNVNKKSCNERLNRSVQSLLHKVIIATSSTGGDENSSDQVVARRCTDMTCELYRRGVWTDERAVAIVASAAASPVPGVMARAIRFFLNVEEKMAQDEKEEDDREWNGAVQRVDLHLHSKKTQARKRQVEKQLKQRRKQQLKRERKMHDLDDEYEIRTGNNKPTTKRLYPAIELLHDPQGLAETVFKRVRSSSSNNVYKFEVKLLMINFVTRLVGNHELLLLPLYPFLQRYMGGHQRDVTAVLAYAVQACHPYVPPDEMYGLLKTIAHNFITERCSGEQMAVGINACKAICARVPSVLSTESDDGGMDAEGGNGTTTTGSTGRTVMDMEAFAQDLAAYSKHRDRSAATAGKAWMNFVREVHPSLLAGKDRGAAGAALHRAGEKPLRYGEQRVAAGVAGADLLAEYEAKKAAYQNEGGSEMDSDSGDDEGSVEVPMNDEIPSDGGDEGWIDVSEDSDEAKANVGNDDGWIEVEDDDEDDSDEEVNGEDASSVEGDTDKKLPGTDLCGEDDSSIDEKAPKLVEITNEDSVEPTIDLSKISAEERKQIQQKVSATRIFTSSDFDRMRKLVAREERDKRDPRAAARRKRAIAKGQKFEELSDDDDSSMDSDNDQQIRVPGAVNPEDIMALANKKRQSKSEKLAAIVAGREKFQHKTRDGGSTNTEKKRKKNFVMQKFSKEMRKKKGRKSTSINKRKQKGLTHEAKKRRRKV